MKTLTTRIATFVGIALISAAMVFSFAYRKDQPEPKPEPPPPPKTPSVLNLTEWKHTSGDTIRFFQYTDETHGVAVKPSGDKDYYYSLKEIQFVAEINQTTLFYKNSQTPDDIIVYRDGKITLVNFDKIKDENRANGWTKK